MFKVSLGGVERLCGLLVQNSCLTLFTEAQDLLEETNTESRQEKMRFIRVTPG
jgi:hypothetical protein